MGRTSNSMTLEGAQKAPFWLRWFGASAATRPDNIWDNGYIQKASSSQDTFQTDVDLIGIDSSNRFRVGGAAFVPPTTTRTFYLPTSAQLTPQAFYIADQAYRVTNVRASFATANGVAMTAVIGKAASGVAATAATAVMSNTFDMNATANTDQSATIGSTVSLAALNLIAGDRLCFVPTGVLTSLAGVVITVQLSPGNVAESVTYAMNLNSLIGTTGIFTATRPMIVTSVYESHGAAGTDAGAVTATVTKETGTTAPGAGTAILTTALSLKTSANIPQAGVLVATATTLRLAAGDRLSVLLAGTLTALAGFVVTVSMQPIGSGKTVNFTSKANAGLVNQAFFDADRNYQVLSVVEGHSTAGTDAGAVSGQVTIASGTSNPSSGVSVLNAVFDLKGTANTIQTATLAARGSTFLMAGDRLCANFTGTLTALAGVQITVELIAV